MRILALSDQIKPFIYQASFPRNLPPIDLVLIAGDLPGHYIEFVATKVKAPVYYVTGNHAEEYVQDYLGKRKPPGGVIDLHGHLARVGPILLAGWGGVPHYKAAGAGQYTEAQATARFLAWTPVLLPRRLKSGHGVDLLLTHAPPPGPHAGTDYAHRSSSALGLFHRLFRPRLHIHGHVHYYESDPDRSYITPEGSRVINAFGYTLFEL